MTLPTLRSYYDRTQKSCICTIFAYGGARLFGRWTAVPCFGQSVLMKHSNRWLRHVFAASALIVLAGCAISARRSWPDVTALPPQRGLPDPLVMLDGGRVVTSAQWERERRPELKAIFQH